MMAIEQYHFLSSGGVKRSDSDAESKLGNVFIVFIGRTPTTANASSRISTR